MKMCYACHGVAGAEVVFDTGAASLYVRLTRDPEAAVLQCLGPAVHPFSRCRVTAHDGVVDRVTGVQGVILQVARLVWVHAAAVEAVGGHSCTHRHAAGFHYHVAQTQGPWAVTAAHLLWRV